MTRVFFTDRDLGNTFPEILKRAGFAVERHRDHFPPDCPDEDWLAEVGKREWVALSHDTRIRYKPRGVTIIDGPAITVSDGWWRRQIQGRRQQACTEGRSGSRVQAAR